MAFSPGDFINADRFHTGEAHSVSHVNFVSW